MGNLVSGVAVDRRDGAGATRDRKKVSGRVYLVKSMITIGSFRLVSMQNKRMKADAA